VRLEKFRRAQDLESTGQVEVEERSARRFKDLDEGAWRSPMLVSGSTEMEQLEELEEESKRLRLWAYALRHWETELKKLRATILQEDDQVAAESYQVQGPGVSPDSMLLANVVNNVAPLLSSLELGALRDFKTKYDAYVRKSPSAAVCQPIRNLLSESVFRTMSRRLCDQDASSNEAWMDALVKFHRPPGISAWIAMVSRAKMAPGMVSRERFATYVEDFSWYRFVAGKAVGVMPSKKKIVKIFVMGLGQPVLLDSLIPMELESLDDAIAIAEALVDKFVEANAKFHFTRPQQGSLPIRSKEEEWTMIKARAPSGAPVAPLRDSARQPPMIAKGSPGRSAVPSRPNVGTLLPRDVTL